MLEPPPDLAPDLEWMLQSGQASDAVLVEMLVREHYAEVSHLASGLTGDSLLAEAVAAQALADAVLNAHRFPAGLGLQDWLFSLVRERASQRREQGVDRPLLTPFLKLSEEPFERAAAEVHKILVGERRRRRLRAVPEILLAVLAVLGVFFAGRWMSNQTPETSPIPTRMQTALVTKLVVITPTPPPQATPTPFPERAILYVAEAGDTLASIAEKTGLEAALLQALNGLEPDAPLQSGQAVMLGLGGIPLAHITPTPVTPAPQPEPLTTASEWHEILQRIFESERYWHTMWVEAQAIEYWPPGIVGPPEVKRLQAWISRPSFSLVLSGGPDGTLERASLTNSGKAYAIDFRTGERYLYTSYGLDLMQLDPLVQQSYTNIETGSEQEIAGIEQVAGREALVVDWYRPESAIDGEVGRSRGGRFWIDVLTGVILRMQRFTKDAGGNAFLVADTVIDEIVYDVNLPNTLFDPYRPLLSHFAMNYTGETYPVDLSLPTPTWVPLPGQEPLPRLTPPPDFDPSRSRLTFQWTHGPAFDNDQATLTDIFAGRYYLGSTDFGDPDRLICARSPDGRKIAYSEWLEEPPYGAAPLRWLDLADVSHVVQPVPGVAAQVLAFSPDSQRLAFLGSEAVIGTGLYVLDLASGIAQRILDFYGGDNLVWSPDGRYLALTGAEHPSASWKLLVVDAGNGAITYQGPVEWGEAGEVFLPEASPALAWGLVMIPPPTSAVEACARPPV